MIAWVDHLVNIDLTETGWKSIHWIDLAEDRDRKSTRMEERGKEQFH
jgi:hypothetical protein